MKTLRTVFVFSLTVGCSLASNAQVNIQSMTKPDLVNYWLHNNCQTDEVILIQTEFSNFATEIEPLLIRSYQDGPPADEIKETENAAAERYEQIQNSLKLNETFGLSKEDIESLQKQNAQDYVSAQKNNFVVAYRSQALLGLAYTGSDQAVAILKKEIENKDSSLTYTAQNALNILQVNQKKKN